MPKELPPVDLLRKLLRYEPETGKLFWRERTPDMFSEAKYSAMRVCSSWNQKNAKKEAFTATCRKTGIRYKSGAIFGQNYFAHRICWKLFFGNDPVGFIDHINGIAEDNRIKNLRDVTHSENCKNQKLRKINKSGVCGVSWNKGGKSGFWVATISGKHLGSFSKFEDAVSCRKKAELMLSYHKNHGRIA